VARAGGQGGESGRLTAEQQREMRQYVTRLERFTPGSAELAAAVEEVRRAVGGAGE
jgi:uncharacterized protein (UPF0335 family)